MTGNTCVNVQWRACDLHVVGIREGEAVIGDGADCVPAILVSTPATSGAQGLNLSCLLLIFLFQVTYFSDHFVLPRVNLDSNR